VHVKAIKLINFKKFRDELLEFNDDVNIFVGDNNAGKSTILEALGRHCINSQPPPPLAH